VVIGAGPSAKRGRARDHRSFDRWQRRGRRRVFLAKRRCLPGDHGPFGVVQYPGALYHIDGTASYTIDANTYATYEFAYSGSITDVCAALS
jgi:hypothetical protein